jgi:monomeric isocitrate dehydrogenase
MVLLLLGLAAGGGVIQAHGQVDSLGEYIACSCSFAYLHRATSKEKGKTLRRSISVAVYPLVFVYMQVS